MGGDDGAVDLALASLAADAAERDHLDAGAVDDERAVRRGRGRATVSGKRRTHVVGARPGDEQAVLVAKHDGVECGVALAGSELERERGPETRRAMLAAIHFHRQIVPNPRGETNFLAVPLIQPPQAGAQPIGSRLQAHRRTVAVTFRRARSLPGMSARALVPIALAVVVSCTTPPGAIIDASSLDASAVDAGIELASVTVHVRTERGDGAADPTATVFLVDPDGQLAATLTPDAAGTVIGSLRPGGSVTVARPGPPVGLETVFAVEDGDVLTFGWPEIRNEQVVTVTVPARAGAFVYGVTGPCMRGTGSTSTFTARFSRACGATHPLVVWARNSTDVSSFVSAPVTPTVDGQVSVTGTWAPDVSTALALEGLEGASSVYIVRSVLIDGAPAHLTTASIAPTNGTANPTFAVPAGIGESVLLEVVTGRGSVHSLYLERPTLTEAAPLDVTPTIAELLTVTQAGATVEWTHGGGDLADAVVIDYVLEAGSENVIAAWRAFAPLAAGSLRLPTLPAPYDHATIPRAGAMLVEQSGVDGFAAFRNRAGLGDWIAYEPVPAPAGLRVELRRF